MQSGSIMHEGEAQYEADLATAYTAIRIETPGFSTSRSTGSQATPFVRLQNPSAHTVGTTGADVS